MIYPTSWFSYLSIFGIFLRFLGLFLLLPGFSHAGIPMIIKIHIAFVLSLALFPLVSRNLPPVPENFGDIVFFALRETYFGLLMGFSAFLTFEGIRLAAQLVGYQMGLGTVGLMDPQNNAEVSILVPLHTMLATVIFFLMDFHHSFIELFLKSFELTSLLSPSKWVSQKLISTLIILSQKLFVIAIQMAAPMTLIMLLCNVVMGVLSRLLPQMNMLLFSFPLTILLSLGVFYMIAPDLIHYLENILEEMSGDCLILLKSF